MESRRATLNFFIISAAAIILIAGMRAAADMLVPFLLSIFIAVISIPPLNWLQSKGLPRWLAMLLIVLGIVGSSALVVTLMGSSVNDFTRSLPEYKERLQNETQGLMNLLDRYNIQPPSELVREHVNPGAAMELVGNIFKGLNSALANIFLILLTVVFILSESNSFSNKLKSAFNDREANSHLASFDTFNQNLQKYMLIKTAISAVTGLMAFVLTWALGIDYPLLWGVSAFFLNYIPTIGSIVAALPAVLLAFVQLGGVYALVCAGGYAFINIFMGNVIEPRYMGKGLGLSTLVVFLSLVFWGWVFGPVGMLLSIPLTMFVKIALGSREETQWLSVLMDSESSFEETPKD